MSQERPIEEDQEEALPVHKVLWIRRAFLLGGHICLGIGLLNLLLPVLPTSPMLLLAAYCYARGSKRFYTWLLSNRFFGPQIRAYRERGCISPFTKYGMMLMFIVGFVGSMLLFMDGLVSRSIVLVLLAMVLFFLARIPTGR